MRSEESGWLIEHHEPGADPQWLMLGSQVTTGDGFDFTDIQEAAMWFCRRIDAHRYLESQRGYLPSGLVIVQRALRNLSGGE